MSAVDARSRSGTPPARICIAGGFLGAHHERNERATWMVVALTTVMMFGEIIGGSVFGSMAVVADGWHMATHAAAMTIAAVAYRYARIHAQDPRFAFGTGKVGELAGFASAVVLGIVALLIGWDSLERLVQPHPIRFSEATGLAVLGLLVNLGSAVLLHQGGHAHGHEHGRHDHAHDHDHQHDHHGHAHGRGGHDSNMRAAYQHVLADALTSLLAIGGLLAGRFLGWVWLDPVVGVVGAVVIASWSWGLMRTAGGALLDMSGAGPLAQAVRARLESPTDEVCDLHVWTLGPGHQALIVSIASTAPLSPDAYKARLAGLKGLSHVTVEVNPPA
jgi:cation diffusion facilitator family transporter